MASLSFSLGNSSKPSQRKSSPPPPSKTTNGTKRAHAALLDDASDDDEETNSKRQTITHFDSTAGGAVNTHAPKKEEKKPLVITALANRDWREASKRQRAQKYGITSEQLDAKTQGAQNAEGADKVVKETEAVKYGLNVFAPSATADAEYTQQDQEPEQLPEDKPEQQKSADQLAIDALMGAAPTSTLTIPTTAITEEDAFNDSYHSAPPAPSLSDYAAVPVEEYGAAMLRGMGWKGPSAVPSKPTNGKKALPPAKRPALLGIGADPNAAAQAEELGAWGKSSSRGRKEPTMFIPVSMKNKKTGETLTEEELREKIRRDKEEAENQRFVVNDLEIRDKKRERRDDEGRKRRDDYSDDEEERRRRRKDYDRHDYKSRDYDRRDRRDRSRDRDSNRESNRDSKRNRSRDYYDKKSSSRRDRSRDREYDRRDRDYEKSSSRRDREYEKSSSRRDRSRDRDYHRSSRR
ncbi:hypothetical protein KCU81_g5202, partial [Aureobasidium melanogenum]|uniref:Pre-mRNA-splicing factor n=1 Tax=Aureobasidium melanogenum (strain CBS 110374) TaxID=1043003 RepID=A0A074VSK3_AURM1